jgi:hypothetical protein
MDDIPEVGVEDEGPVKVIEFVGTVQSRSNLSGS